MKTARDIIAQLTLAREKSVLTHRVVLELVHFLPPLMRQTILFWYIRGDTLFFVIANPALIMEFNYKQTLIKGLLSDLLAKYRDEQLLGVKKIRAFHGSRTLEEHTEEPPVSLAELAEGAFENPLSEESNKELLEEIRALIKANRARR